MDGFINSILTISFWEALAVFLSITYLILAMRQNILCWAGAFFSTLIYTILFFDALLLMDSLLNAYYLLMALYGWHSWKHGKNRNEELKVSSWGLKTNLKIVVVLGIISLLVGYIMDNYTKADFAYLDAATTVFAIFTTYMLAKKILENWLYWIVIDFVSIYIYINKAFYLTAGLFILYTILAFFGFLEWKKAGFKNGY
jgi:nicotinamide mononucleotide transporter